MCLYPLKAYYPIDGKKPVFTPKLGYIDRKLELPCGQCAECRLKRSKEWAIRCLHEAKCHEQNIFITLTYENDPLTGKPPTPTISKREHQLFVKRFRKYLDSVGKKSSIKYYMCGEYGDSTFRPHYHYCVFGYDFPDKKPYKKNHMGQMLWTSATLTRIWGKGYAIIGDVTFESAGYVARYVMKKITGKQAEDYYKREDLETGEVIQLLPEFNEMSRRPGIGKTFYDKFKGDIFPSDECVVNGKKLQPPKYYMKLFQVSDEELASYIKAKRKIKALKNPRTELENNAKIYNFELKKQKLKRPVE